MKVLMLNGSVRKNGNTEAALSEIRLQVFPRDGGILAVKTVGKQAVLQVIRHFIAVENEGNNTAWPPGAISNVYS